MLCLHINYLFKNFKINSDIHIVFKLNRKNLNSNDLIQYKNARF